jgi:hypothetical protein
VVDWRKVELPLPDIIKYVLAVGPVLALLATLCLQLGSYKTKVDALVEQNKKNSEQLYEQSQDINEIKMVLRIQQIEQPQKAPTGRERQRLSLRPLPDEVANAR